MPTISSQITPENIRQHLLEESDNEKKTYCPACLKKLNFLNSTEYGRQYNEINIETGNYTAEEFNAEEGDVSCPECSFGFDNWEEELLTEYAFA